MKQKDIIYLVITGFFVAVVTFVVTNLIFKIPSNRSTDVPTVQPITATFPDIKNDPSYKSFLNSQALDPTQPIQIGNDQNPTPFNSSR